MSAFPPYDWEANREKLVDHVGHYLTLSLFEELKRPDVKIAPLFKLSDWKKLYIAVADPTEYETAMVLIGNWQHWLALRANKVLARYFDEWQQEVDIKLRSLGVRNMISLAGSTSPGAAGSAKWLAEAGYIEDKRLKTKAGQEREAAVKDAVKDRVADDARRLGLVKTT
jgi:hypothetical protein